MPTNERIISPVRVAFSKTGSLSFISHLDLMRTVSRMLVRADIGVYYTEGFNPHPKLTFAMPLSVGAESVSEMFDIKVVGSEPADCETILERLRREAPTELPIREVYAPERKFHDIAYAEYKIVIHHADMPRDADAIVGRLTESPVIELKRTKSGEQERDIREFIASLSAVMSDGDLHITTRLSADSEHYLNPEYVVRAVRRVLVLGEDDIAPGGDVYSITRTGVFDASGNIFR